MDDYLTTTEHCPQKGNKELKILRGYERPVHQRRGFPEFQNWIDRTLEKKDQKLIEDSITYLEIKVGNYKNPLQGNSPIRDARTLSRLEEGLNKLKENLN